MNPAAVLHAPATQHASKCVHNKPQKHQTVSKTSTYIARETSCVSGQSIPLCR